MKAVIVGAGIGGLTTALCLHEFGWQVQVIEKSPNLEEIGAGIQVSPNAMNVFEILGLDQEIIKAGFLPEAIEMRLGKSGMRLIRMEVRQEFPRRYGSPYVHIHRADLIEILVKAIKCRMPQETIHLGSSFEKYNNRKNNVTVRSSVQKEIPCDLLIGADGIHSSVRTQMLGSDEPQFTGNVAWRAVIPIERMKPIVVDPTACVWVGRRKHAVTYLLRGGKLANLVAVVEQKKWLSEDWNVEGSLEEAKKDFKDWHPTITSLIANSKCLHKWALYDRRPLSKWSDDRVVVIGDAAHPMLPFMAQGGAMAIEDGWVLANFVSRGRNIENSLEEFYRKRIQRTSMVQDVSRKNGRLFHNQSTLSSLFSYLPIWMVGKSFPVLGLKLYDKIFSLDEFSD